MKVTANGKTFNFLMEPAQKTSALQLMSILQGRHQQQKHNQQNSRKNHSSLNNP